MSIGKVLWFDRAKGYGFISTESGEDVFLHYSMIPKEIVKSLRSGVKVTFNINKGEKGLTASQVSVIA